MKPSDFLDLPMDSVLQSNEAEVVAQNIMVILMRTGDEFRDLSWEEYRTERAEDGSFSVIEKDYFDQVIGFCTSAGTAILFSPVWNRVKAQN